MFLSKFVFVGVIDLLFGDNINMYGFFGILAGVAGVTIAHKLTDSTFKKLGE
jgi:drug/metabolite transporter (DMT)-like permease